LTDEVIDEASTFCYVPR